MLIVLEPYRGGGIGNYLFHLCHSVMHAQIKQATLLVPTPLSFRTMNRGAVALDFSESSVSYGDEMERLGPFIHGNEATRMFGFPYRFHCMQDQIKPLFDPAADHAPVSAETLVIHIRSGDIFAPGGSNRKYGQPPLSWYRRLLDDDGVRDVLVVTEAAPGVGAVNPVVEALAAFDSRVRIQSKSTEFDFHTLRNCRQLALSGGTFSVAAAMLNTRLARLHVPEYARPHDPNFTDVFPPGHDYGFDLRKWEIRGYENLECWENRPDQRRTMLEHRNEDVLLVSA